MTSTCLLAGNFFPTRNIGVRIDTNVSNSWGTLRHSNYGEAASRKCTFVTKPTNFGDNGPCTGRFLFFSHYCHNPKQFHGVLARECEPTDFEKEGKKQSSSKRQTTLVFSFSFFFFQENGYCQSTLMQPQENLVTYLLSSSSIIIIIIILFLRFLLCCVLPWQNPARSELSQNTESFIQ